MCSTDEIQVVAVEELADNVGAEGEGNSPIILPPSLDVFIWVRPQQVAQQAWNQSGTGKAKNSILKYTVTNSTLMHASKQKASPIKR